MVNRTNKALILTWDGYQDQEVIYPYYRLLEENLTVDIAAENKGPVYGLFKTKLIATVETKQLGLTIFPADYDILVVPGGVKALEKLRQQKNAVQWITTFADDKSKIIASTCHGAQMLISAKITNGRRISGYYSIADDITNSGATYVNEPYVMDENIITSPHYDHMGPWMRKVINEYYLRTK
jgi:protease I